MTCNTISYSTITPAYQCFLSAIDRIHEPQDFEAAITDPHWMKVMQQEMTALQDNGTWKLVELPKGKTLIGRKWVYKVKYNSYGTLQ